MRVFERVWGSVACAVKGLWGRAECPAPPHAQSPRYGTHHRRAGTLLLLLLETMAVICKEFE